MSGIENIDPDGTDAISFRLNETPTEGPKLRHWFRGEHTNYAPSLADLMTPDAAEAHVLAGWMPDTPCITPQTQITAFGSCFAKNISNWLSERNFRILNADTRRRAYVVRMGEGMVNSFAIRQQFEWAWEGQSFEQPLWHGWNAEECGYDEDIRLETRAMFDATDIFILTFGLSEVWYDEPTGAVFWRAIPRDVFDPARHKFRVSSVAENRENIRAIYDLIRKHRPDARVIVTLSPVPLAATFRDVSCITANAVSKATLRVAIDEVMREVRDEGHLFYWPSYEIVTDVFRLPYKPDRRHLPLSVLNHVMRLFEKTWCRDSTVDEREFLESWTRANLHAGILPASLEPVFQRGRPYPLRKYLTETRLHADDDVDAAMRRMLDRLRVIWRQRQNAAEAAAAAPEGGIDQPA